MGGRGANPGNAAMTGAAAGHVGLCAACRHARRIVTPRNGYWLCGRSREEPAFERYPRLPVRDCPGYEPLSGVEGVPEGPPPGRRE